MQSEEFHILNDKLDQLLAILKPRERAWSESRTDFDQGARNEYCRISNVFSKRSHKLNNPWDRLSPEQRAKILDREEQVWRSLSDDGTVTAEQRKFYKTYSKALDEA